MSDRDEVVLGVDLGSTAVKVVAVDRALRQAGAVERAQPLRSGARGEAVHDPRAVLAAVFDAVRESAARAHEEGRRVSGLSFSAAMHTLLGLDAALDPVTDALSWADTRSAGSSRRIREEAGTELHRATGTPVHPMSPLSKLAWLAEEGAAGEAAFWCGVKDFVLHRLTGRLVTDLSCASGTGLLELGAFRWYGPALRAASVTAGRLPELVEPTALLRLEAGAAGRLGLPAGLPVVAGAGDGPLANLGVGAVHPGTAALSLGTSGALRVVRDRPGVDEGGRVFCYYLAEGMWVTGGAVSNAGVVAQWAADHLGGVPLAELLDEAAAVAPGAEGLLALPYLLGERAPWWDPEASGALIGLRREHGRAAIARALVEGVGQQLALVRDALLAAGARVESVRATGGAFRARLWADVLAAALDTPLEIVSGAAGSGYGAALLGWRALGALPSLDLRPFPGADPGEPGRTVRPDPHAARRMRQTRPLVERAHLALRELTRAGHAGAAATLTPGGDSGVESV
jgi:gluconokinase